jgi:hypothetical protein
MRLGTILPRDSSLEDNIFRALGWISHYRENRVDCNAAFSSRMLTQVLNLSPPASAELKSGDIRLHEPRHDEPIDYVCLSHYWSNTRCSQLTTIENVSSLLRSIDTHALPQTLRDAVRVTRRLGLRFLWIDAFCIILTRTRPKNLQRCLLFIKCGLDSGCYQSA